MKGVNKLYKIKTRTGNESFSDYPYGISHVYFDDIESIVNQGFDVCYVEAGEDFSNPSYIYSKGD